MNRVSQVIKEITDKGEKQINIAKTLGVSRSTITAWISGTVKNSISPETALKIEQHYGYNHKWLILGELPKMISEKKELVPDERWVAIKFVNISLKAGITGYAVNYLEDEESEPLFFKRSWIDKKGYDPKKLYALKVKGESMSPTLSDGSVVMIDIDNQNIKNSDVFAVNYHGEPVVKRIVSDFGKTWLVSDNPDKSSYPNVQCDDDTTIIGRVVYTQSEL